MSHLSEFIKNELSNRKSDYTSSPTYILEHYNSERQNIEAYNGRQLLEMLQNADDAAETATTRKVSIQLSGKTLVIANTGEPFTQDGFRSILYISVSPKTKARNKIGYKGLGFRSILSWADEVIINSGGTRVAFSRQNAIEFLNEIVTENSEVGDFLRARSDEPNPIAILRIPKLVDKGKPAITNFDTVITLYLKDNIVAEVQQQIRTLINKETLIFLNNITEIEINSADGKSIFTKRIDARTGEVIVDHINVATGHQESKHWHIEKRTGQHQGKNYELAVAWNDALDDSEHVLFSYFKTEAKFPFPALLHGTFELTQDRKHLENDTAGHNKFLIGELATLLTDTALIMAARTPSDNYLPLKLLNIDFGSIDTLLTQFDFKGILIEKIKAAAIFPTVNGNYIDYSQKPVFYQTRIAECLVGQDVPNLMPPADETLVPFLNSLPTYYYTLEYFSKIIAARIHDLPIEGLAKLCHHFLTYYKRALSEPEFNIDVCAAFLPDLDLSPIPWNSSIFVQREDAQDFRLPGPLNIRFLHPVFVAELAKLFILPSPDRIFDTLKPFKVHEYSFSEIIEILILHYTTKERLSVHEIKELHSHLFHLFKREVKLADTSIKRPKTTIPVITLAGKKRNANEVYLGKGYGNSLAQSLYSFDRNKLLANPDKFGIGADEVNLARKYFIWVGIADRPRYTLYKFNVHKSHPYLKYVLRNLKYPISKWGWSFRDYNELFGWLNPDVTFTAGVFDDIEKICSSAKLVDIFDWLKQDDRFRLTLEQDRETLSGTSIYYYKHTDRVIDQKQMPSFTKWTTSQIPLLKGESNQSLVPPTKCCLSKTITRDFSPFVEKPDVPIAKFADHLDLKEDVIEHYLVLLGVHREISTFSMEALYQMLSSLPTADKEGKAARKIYREIISNFNEAKLDITDPAYQVFIRSGKIYCRKGTEQGFFPVQQSYYIPTRTYGNNILKRFPLAEIDSKQGAQKIERLFGVKRLKDITFSVDGEPTLSPLNDAFQHEMDRFKSLIYVLRQAKDTNHDIAGRLKKLKITLAQELQTKFFHLEESISFDLDDFEYIPASKRTNQFYISVPPDLTSLSQLRDSNQFCQSIAEIFSSLIETEEFGDFIHDLYSKPETAREPRLLNFLQKDDNTDLADAKRQLNIIDDIRLSFWRAFSFACHRAKAEIRNEEDLNVFLTKKLELTTEQALQLTSMDFYHQLNEFAVQEVLYHLFKAYQINQKVFDRHFDGVDFSEFFKYNYEIIKTQYRNDFSEKLYNYLIQQPLEEKMGYFDIIDRYEELIYNKELGFLSDTEATFLDIIRKHFSIHLTKKGSAFSIEDKITASMAILEGKGVIVPVQLRENRSFQALLAYAEMEEIDRFIEMHQKEQDRKPSDPETKEIHIRGANISFNYYDALATKILAGLNMDLLKLTAAKTVPVLAESTVTGIRGRKNKTRKVRFSTDNEEQIGFVAELICYHKLVHRYGEANVDWVSENAYRAYPKKFMTREAGMGYDIVLIDHGKPRYIEVKGSANIGAGIYMSNKEMQKAMQFPEWYDLIIVLNPLGDEPALKHVRSPFKFKKNESLFSNSKLTVFNDSYIIKFKWEQ